jgi:signal transduction histidine kinase
LDEKGILVVEKREISGVGSASGIQTLMSLIKAQQQMRISAEDYMDSKLAMENQINNFYTPIHDEFNRILDGVQSYQNQSLSLNSILISLIVITMSAIVLLGYLLYRSILIPVNSLGKVAREITGGNLTVAPNTKGNDEITELSVQFDNMRRCILAVNTNLNDLVKARTAELEQAYNQLQKHKKELELANTRLLETDRIKNEFINIAAHEMRTPVLPIVLSAESLADEMPDNANINIILRNANRITKLTNDILDVSRIESNSFKLQKQKVNIRKLAEEVIQDGKLKMAKKHDVDIVFESSVSASMEEVEIDRSRITQVLVNIVDNAVNFTETGTIRVLLEQDREAPGYMRISVKDSGKGIDPEVKGKLFEKFVSKSDRAKGTGLGLYLSKAIVEAHGGTIGGENNPDGKGATFYFSIPAG